MPFAAPHQDRKTSNEVDAIYEVSYSVRTPQWQSTSGSNVSHFSSIFIRQLMGSIHLTLGHVSLALRTDLLSCFNHL